MVIYVLYIMSVSKNLFFLFISLLSHENLSTSSVLVPFLQGVRHKKKEIFPVVHIFFSSFFHVIAVCVLYLFLFVESVYILIKSGE